MRSDGGVAGRSCVCTVRKSAGGMVRWCVLLVVVHTRARARARGGEEEGGEVGGVQ